MTKQQTHISKFISLILRHNPAKFNFTIEYNGAWANTNDLIQLMKDNDKVVSIEDLDIVVAADDKGRYSYSADKSKIRANQGHSIDVDLGLVALELKDIPNWLYHGTNSRFLDLILDTGLNKMGRHHVHLSDNIETAKTVGDRRLKKDTYTKILKISTIEMVNAGFEFYRAENGVYLIDFVPAKYLR
jgi:putative RNA 2'-phosphotransferase